MIAPTKPTAPPFDLDVEGDIGEHFLAVLAELLVDLALAEQEREDGDA